MSKLNVLFASFEALPFIKTGGLGEVAGALPRAVQCPTIEMRVMLPKLSVIPREYHEKMKFICSFYVPLGWRSQYCGLFELRMGRVTWYFLDNEYYFNRENVYDYFDDGERMAFFSKAICESLRYLPEFFPNVLHCNDWHTALAPVFLREHYRYAPGYDRIKTVLTIHNLKYQGVYDPAVLEDILGLGGCEPARNQLSWNYGRSVNYMAGGVNYADWITTVSPTYAREICDPYFGEGMQELFIRRRDVLSGILNGIDTDAWDPAKDKALAENYSSPEGKAANKAALQRELGLPEEPDTPLCVAVSPLTEQKGFDLLDAVAEELLDSAQVAVLGVGEASYENHYKQLASRRPDRFSASILSSEALSRRMFAGADLFLMPSRIESCGVSQMIAMRYGALPVVRQTGGLADSVIPCDRSTGEGNGFAFANYNAHELLFTVKDACALYREDPGVWKKLQEQAMAADFSWHKSALAYRELYRSLFA